ncbi:HDOD domain-containing protein [Pseudomonas grimontii]|uniref:HDOD domain-containing protein n=1 Tax=Pseudomonas grimontii TaxID=129847 RepID=UPI00387AD9DE
MSNLDKIFNRPAALPTISKVVLELLEMLNDPDTPTTAIVRAIRKDQVLAAKVLRVANSSFYGRSGEVSSLDVAIGTLGLHTLRTTVLTTGLMKALPDAPGIDMVSYWRMSLRTAFMASEIASRCGVNRDEAFSTGLMQGLGVLVIHLAMPEEALLIAGQVDPLFIDGRRSTDRKILGFDNADVCAELLRRWKFPDSIQIALLSYSNATGVTDKLSKVLALSSLYAYGINVGLSEGEIVTTIQPQIVTDLNLPQDWLERCRDNVAASVNFMAA